MGELRLDVVIDPKLPRQTDGVVAIGEFDGEFVYPSGGLAFFCVDLVLGRPFPLKLVTRDIDSPGTLAAITLFLRRDLAIEPGLVPFAAAIAMFEAWGAAGLAHADRDLARFILLLSNYIPPGLSQKEQEDRLEVAVGWIAAYLQAGSLPNLPPEPAPPRVLDRGTDGFVLAELPGATSLEYGWLELYRQGFLRGALFTQPIADRRLVLVAKKSDYVRLDLGKASAIFNEAEAAMGEDPGWTAEPQWLWSPQSGTMLLISAITDVLIRS